MKTFSTYLLFIICLTGVCCVSFNASFKLLKQSVEIVFSEVDAEDIGEDDIEENEANEDAKLTSSFDRLALLIDIAEKSHISAGEAKLVLFYKNIQSPPPKRI